MDFKSNLIRHHINTLILSLALYDKKHYSFATYVLNTWICTNINASH